MFQAIVNTPGYLPDNMGDIPEFDTASDAWWYLYHERCNYETGSDFPCELCNDESTHGLYGDCDDDTETGISLGAMARAGQPGTVYGTGYLQGSAYTPDGWVSDRIAYSVVEVPE